MNLDIQWKSIQFIELFITTSYFKSVAHQLSLIFEVFWENLSFFYQTSHWYYKL